MRFEQGQAGFGGNQAQLEAVFKIDDAVAEVVGGFYQQGQRVAVVEAGGGILGQQTQFVGHVAEAGVFGLEMAVFLFRSAAGFGGFGHQTGARVFGESAQRGVGEAQAGGAGAVRRVGVGEDAEAGRVALKMLQIGHFGPAELRSKYGGGGGLRSSC